MNPKRNRRRAKRRLLDRLRRFVSEERKTKPTSAPFEWTRSTKLTLTTGQAKDFLTDDGKRHWFQ